MCLFTKTRRKRAGEDIECYKKIYVSYGWIKAPYTFVDIPLEVVEGKKPYIASGKEIVLDNDFLGCKMVGGGFIHTYKNLSEAYRFAGDNDIVIKCVIPKGSYYFEGHDQHELQCYASKRIKFMPTPEQIDAIFVKKITI